MGLSTKTHPVCLYGNNKNRRSLGETVMAKNSKEKAVVLDENGRPPLKLDYGQTFKVGFAFAIIMIFWTAYDFVVPLLLENAYGLPSWGRGLIMGLDNLLSLFMLPIFGKLSDKAHGKIVKKFGRRTPFIVVGTIASVVLMVFVPVATLGQQKAATKDLTAHLATVNFEEEFGKWYDAAVNGEKVNGESAANFCDLQYIRQNKDKYEGKTERDFFVGLAKALSPEYEKMTSKKAVLNMLGATTYYYDGNVVEDLNAICPETGVSYQEMVDVNANYKAFAANGVENYKSDYIFEHQTKTKSGITSLVIYMVILLLVLIAMTTFRSPAVALMPDVTPKPLRSQGNAIINLCGGVGGAIAFLIYTVALFKPSINTYVIIFACVGAGMLLLLAGFLALVRERKMVAKCQEICKEYGIDDFAEGESEHAEKFAEELIEDYETDAENQTENKAAALDEANDVEHAEFGNDGYPNGEAAELMDETPEHVKFAKEVVENSKQKRQNPKEWWNSKTKDERGKLVSFWLILASIFMWFMGYNAVSSNLSVYTTKGLNLSAGIASIISGVSMGVSAIAFIPVGYLAAKIGRRKSIIIGYILAVISFVLICFAIMQGQGTTLKSVLFALFYVIAGFGLIIANVNTFPMVTELSTAETVGAYTGYYYVATMSAQAITPFIAGLVMDYVQDKYLFLYSAACIVIAIVLMLFVKHGDSMILAKGRKLTKEEKRQIRLDSMDSAD